MATSSRVSGGCIISGARIDKSPLFTGVHVHSYGELSRVVALPQEQIRRRARLKNVVIDRGVTIPRAWWSARTPRRTRAASGAPTRASA